MHRLWIQIACLVCLPLPAPRETRDAPWAQWKELASAAGHYVVRYHFSVDPLPQGESFGCEAYVFDRGAETPRANVKLLVDAAMPEHGHGLAREPVLAQDKDGRLRASGLRLHMVGRWQIYFDVVAGAHTERAQLDLQLE